MIEREMIINPQEYIVGDIVRAVFDNGEKLNIRITGISCKSVGEEAESEVSYKFVKNRNYGSSDKGRIVMLEKIRINPCVLMRMKKEFGFKHTDGIWYNGTLGIEHLRPDYKSGYKAGWSVYFRDGVYRSVIRGIKYINDFQHALIAAKRYDISNSLHKYFCKMTLEEALECLKSGYRISHDSFDVAFVMKKDEYTLITDKGAMDMDFFTERTTPIERENETGEKEKIYPFGTGCNWSIYEEK